MAVERLKSMFFANILMEMAFRGQINHPIGFYVKFRVYIGQRYIYILYIYVRCGRLHPSTEIPSQLFHICICSSPYIYIITLDADFDEDSDSDLKLEIGAHLDLVFEG